MCRQRRVGPPRQAAQPDHRPSQLASSESKPGPAITSESRLLTHGLTGARVGLSGLALSTGKDSGRLWPRMAAGKRALRLPALRELGGGPVTTGPENPAAAGLGRLRAGHADREQVIEMLKNAFVHGRLTRDELDARAGRAITARTYAELAALTADIPDIPAAARPGAPVRPGPASAAGQGGRRVGQLPGHRGRRRVGRRPRRSGRPRPQSLSFLGSPVPCRGLFRCGHGTLHCDQRGGHRSGAEAFGWPAATPAWAGRLHPEWRPARQRRPWRGFPRSPPRPDPSRRSGSQVTAAPAARSRPGGPGSTRRQASVGRGVTPMRPAPESAPPRLRRHV